MNVGYSKTFPHPSTGQWEKIWAEEQNFTGTIEEARKVWYAIKKEVENFHYESNKAAEKQMEVSVKVIESAPYDEEMHNHNKTYTLEEQINSCTSIKVLETYKFIVKGKSELETVYNNRLKELT